MVLPIVAAATCVPCMAAATTFSSSAAAAATGVLGVTGVAVVRKTFKKGSKKGPKKCKDKKKKSDKKKDKKKTKKKKPIKGGGNSFKKEEKKIFKELHSCNQKCSKTMNTKYKKPLIRSFHISNIDKELVKNPIIEMNTKEKIIWNKHRVKKNKCRKLCSKSQQKKLKTHKKKFSKEYRVINKENQKNCCRCKYIKQNNKYFKVRGSYGHCAYDMTNCCKDKKKSKTKSK